MKALVEIDVFDDPKYCAASQSSNSEKCSRLGSKTHHNYCNEFKEYLHYYCDIPTKCDQCKNAIKRAKAVEFYWGL